MEEIIPVEDSYAAFLAGKRRTAPAAGIEVSNLRSPDLFNWQIAIVQWALHHGRAAIFAGTGLGKTRMQVTWAEVVARATGGDVLILAPLAVAQQTIHEAARIGVVVRYCRSQADVQPGITITNYDMLHTFDLGHFVGIVLDESSCLKAHDSKTRKALTEGAQVIHYRLCCTATPAPNDHMELGNHAEFLGIMTQSEMLAMYFVHDGGSTQDWRLKGHARADFWRWVASWAVLLRMPGDIGYDDTSYVLPPLTTHLHTVDADGTWLGEQGYLLPPPRLSLTQARCARRDSLAERVAACADLVNATPGPWLVFCDLNEESAGLARAIGDAVEVKGSDSREHKIAASEWFLGRICDCQLQRHAKPICDSGLKNTGTTSGSIDEPLRQDVKHGEENSTQQIQSVEGRRSPKHKHGKKQIQKPTSPADYANTESPQTSTGGYLSGREVGAPSAGNQCARTQIPGAVNNGGCTLTTATLPEKSVESSAQAATWGLENSQRTQSGSNGLHCTCGGIKDHRVLISKASIFGWGLNFQHCSQVAFVGVNYSYELYYQAIRRCWRFGQEHPVNVHVFLSEPERAIFAVLEVKERAADEMRLEMVRHMAPITCQALGRTVTRESSEYAPGVEMILPDWLQGETADACA